MATANEVSKRREVPLLRCGVGLFLGAVLMLGAFARNPETSRLISAEGQGVGWFCLVTAANLRAHEPRATQKLGRPRGTPAGPVSSTRS